MTKKETLIEFRGIYMPIIKNKEKINGIDKPLRREMWNNYTDYLFKDGRITRNQFENWTNPYG